MTAVSAALTLPADPRSPRRARDFVQATLHSWGLVTVLDDAKLLTSELVTNAVLHARTQVTLTVTSDDERDVVRVSVSDQSPVVPRRRRYSSLATTGRGLNMVDDASQAHGVEPSAAGKAVWFEIGVSSAGVESLTDHR